MTVIFAQAVRAAKKENDIVTTKTVRFLLVLMTTTVIIGYLVDWWLTAGIGVGAVICWYVVTRRYSVIDDLDTSIWWWTRRGWREQPPGENVPKWSEFWRPALLLVALIVAVVVMVVGLMR